MTIQLSGTFQNVGLFRNSHKTQAGFSVACCALQLSFSSLSFTFLLHFPSFQLIILLSKQPVSEPERRERLLDFGGEVFGCLMMRKRCELCESPARMYCESDQASLCWDCDAKVHSANFLVARHSRSLLCHVCQSTMAWSASGTKLGPTVSVCERCVDGCDHNVKRNDDADGGDELSNEDEDDAEDEYDGDEEEEEEDEEDALDDEDEDGDNQVVPWSSTPPPPAASSSSSEDELSRFSNGDGDVSLKRMRETVSDLPFDV